MRRVHPAMVAAACLVMLFLLAPLLVVLLMAFSGTEAFHFPPPTLSLRWFHAFFASDSYFNSLFRVSIPLGLAAGGVAMVLGTLAALALVRFDLRRKAAVQAVLLSPLFMPHILLGAGFYLYFARLGLGGGWLALVASHVIIGVPYVLRSVAAGLANMDPRLEEAAMSLGASRLQAFAKVTLPIARTSILSGGIFAFVVSFSDVNVSLFVAGTGLSTLPVHVFSQVQFESDPTIAAASALQILLVGLLMLALQGSSALRRG